CAGKDDISATAAAMTHDLSTQNRMFGFIFDPFVALPGKLYTTQAFVNNNLPAYLSRRRRCEPTIAFKAVDQC
ncbi:MAG TPA: hypothetical protein VNV13_05240, partial [Steroidobacteraceae bacterium]|nr:hypothetical protein [Steroidobacteraceae bacterium]